MNADELFAQARQLLAASRYHDAVNVYQQVIQLAPNHPLPHAELALALTQINRLDEAEQIALQVLEAVPNLGVAEAAVGIAHSNRNRPDLALPWLQKAVEHAPDLIIARQMCGVCYTNLGRFKEANDLFETVVILQPAHPHARFSIAMRQLYERNYADGWREYEWRWLTGQLNKPEIPRPRWDGRDLTGKSILVHTEQGIGDAVQLVRLMPLLRTQKNAAKIIFACQKAIQQLLRDSVDVDGWFPIDEPATINFDCYTPMLALPALLKTNEHNMPRERQYVKPDPARMARWKPIVDAIPGFKIGIGWQGSPTYIGDAYRSIPLKFFETLAKIPGVTLVSLQRLHGQDQLTALRDTVPVRELDGLDADAAFVDTAAVLQHLDLCVTCDSALGHIAGAVGAPTFIALSLGHDWRWQAEREDTPWYPSVRLFRQTGLHDWQPVFERMAAVIRKAMNDRAALAAPPPPLGLEQIKVEIQAGELFDKITILELKLKRIRDAKRLANVQRELDELTAVRDRLVPATPTLDQLVLDLADVNLAIWDNEERMRAWAAAGDFGPDYVAGARSIAINNDRRAAIKREINSMLGSRLIEEKSYGDK